MEQILSKAVGIDLGTTNSAVAVMNRTDTDILLHRDKYTATTPSCLWKDPRSGELVVGRMAARRVGTTPAPIRSIKRLMGQRETVRVTDEDMTPEQVSAHILAEMKRQIEQDLAGWDSPDTSWEVDRAIVTVPAYFDQPAIKATRNAAEIAGLEVLDLLHEPTAAACYHCWSSRIENGTFLVYDLGGGTFDVSVVQRTSGAFEVLGISGNNMLGGDNIDVEMAVRLQEYLVEDGYAFDLDTANDAEDRIRFAQLKMLAEGVKQALSTQDVFMFRDNGTMRDKDGQPVIIDRMVERAEFEAIVRPLVGRTLGYCHEAAELAAKQAGITLSDVDEVILAGGSTHIPLVREMVARELCGPTGARRDEPVYEKVDTIVALGAAIQASAGGLRSHDRGRTVRVSFRGTAATDQTVTQVTGRAEALAEGIDLTGGHIRLVSSHQDEEADLGKDGDFAFRRVQVQTGAESLLSFELYDAQGARVLEAARSVISDPSVIKDSPQTPPLNKTFSLLVNRAGKPYLKELVPAMAQLPAEVRFSFQHPGNVERVLFPLYQNRLRVQVFEVAVPASTERGTEVVFDVRIDGQQQTFVRGSVGSTEFDVRVVDAPPRPVPTQDQIDSLASRYRDAAHYLKAGDRAVADAKRDRIVDSLDKAVARKDNQLVLHEFEELEYFVDGLAEVEVTLEPPKSEFDETVADCRRLNHRVRQAVEDTSITHDEQEVARSIDAQVDQGERAYRNRDQRAYGEAIEQLMGILRWLQGRYRQTPAGKDNRTEQERIADYAAAIADMAKEVMRLAEAKERGDLQREIADIARDLTVREREAEQNPARAQTRINQHNQRLRQIRSLLLSGGRDDLDGLVMDSTT
ncbi:Hsp70 family protein [Kutzneria sp. CA-103260]|uniref:Hsp70 family protein n=1 Tax=Kutzneria sp. CA-103260 TaxID=2802641 RepID=UPI001BA6B1FA|nr:Hsp70 family protein [Kutzneria sp. CA-103260]QUQ67113.1 Chaperone protein DnaK [Kutzneria sp. CA-103260]